jgi:two-component system sensor histidine kinase PilS (NtrC family)
MVRRAPRADPADPARVGPAAPPTREGSLKLRSLKLDAPKLDATGSGALFGQAQLLRGIYIGRVILVSGILAAAFVVWRTAQPQQTLVATLMFVTALPFTSWSYWRTHFAKVAPGEVFLYAQVSLDVMLVTAIVQITSGPSGQESAFAPLYILVISEGALLLPLIGGVLMGVLASLVYLALLVWFHDARLYGPVGLQIGLFSVVAIATGFLGDRLRRAGLALGAVESELRQLRLDTSDILATIGTGVLTVDGAGRLAYLNPAGEAMLGLDARQWMGAPVLDAVEGVAPGLGMVMRRSVADRVAVARFKTTTTKDGHDLVLGISTAVLERADGGPPSVTAIYQDITDLERIDALNRRTERLEAVAELAASLAHEIRNPLASIRSAVEQLTRPALALDDRQLLQRLVVSESDRLSRLLSEFLEFTGLRRGPAEQVDLASVVRDAVALVQQQADGVTVKVTGLDQPRVIPGDADLLHRAVFNLVLNAVQFAGPSGEVGVSLERVGAGKVPPGLERRDPLRLVVRDSGPGVDPSALGRIFDPFYTTRPGGTGLGLAVVHRAVQAHDGAVFVDRAPAGGAEFTMVLPGRAGSGGAAA